jgi:AcrR family transcriptional regulator
MPRRYRLGERAAQVEATRQRIMDAAIDLYVEIGVSAATMREIGARADVAPGTLRKHFSTRDDLDRAMVGRLTESITLPDLSIFDGARSIDERLERVIAAGAQFIDGAQRLYRMWLREPMLSEPWLETGAAFGAAWDAVMRAALGPLSDDEDALAALQAVIHPSFFDNLRAGGRSTDDAAALAASLVVPWFAAREREALSLGRPPRARRPRSRQRRSPQP